MSAEKRFGQDWIFKTRGTLYFPHSTKEVSVNLSLADVCLIVIAVVVVIALFAGWNIA